MNWNEKVYITVMRVRGAACNTQAHFIRTPQLSVLDLEQFGMGEVPGSFPVSVRVRTKHAEKTRVGL
ncbi:hypothetical protein MTR_8g067220 [Medicago truncatula]|uniref:Uncharacterized protein n=1 Tax=Medicago truncatula TaxID=3880 RepID=G7LHQ8_MEDTR|nr:hypothetical protein MTR_8g067220 [Medicago truncatula]